MKAGRRSTLCILFRVPEPFSIPKIVFFISTRLIRPKPFFRIISLTTIGFGDLLPRNDPPLSAATKVRNETGCLFELINPIPSKNVNNQTGLSKLCDQAQDSKFF